jgi:hypothetical protein
MLPIIREGLVLELHFNELAGSTVYDLSGNNNNGTIFGATRVQEGFNRALLFDGVDDYIQANTVNVPYLTISVWVNWFMFFPDSGGHAIISNSNNAQDGYMLYQAVSSPYNRIRTFVYTSSIVTLDSNSLLDNNKWYHVVLTYDGSFINLYINGVLDNQKAQSGTIKATTNPFIIGSTYTGAGYKFKGIIDEVLIYNRALSEDEIKAIYNYYMKKRTGKGF